MVPCWRVLGVGCAGGRDGRGHGPGDFGEVGTRSEDGQGVLPLAGHGRQQGRVFADLGGDLHGEGGVPGHEAQREAGIVRAGEHPVGIHVRGDFAAAGGLADARRRLGGIDAVGLGDAQGLADGDQVGRRQDVVEELDHVAAAGAADVAVLAAGEREQDGLGGGKGRVGCSDEGAQ